MKKELFRCIGAFVLAIIVLGVPVLFALSWIYLWPVFWPLFWLTVCDLIVLATVLANYSDNIF